MFGVPGARRFTPDRWLHGGDEVTVGEMRFEVRHCPGHTPGHVIFASATFGVAFVGDVLFQGSIGRTDFPRGDHATLIRSITTQLWPLGDDMQFVPGHGPMSTFGAERRSNPFVGDAALRGVAALRDGRIAGFCARRRPQGHPQRASWSPTWSNARTTSRARSSIRFASTACT